jgi:uncharacterized protein YrrD
MRNSKEFIGKPVYSLDEGRQLGTVRDIYVDRDLSWLVGVHLGREGLLSRKSLLIPREAIAVFGVDAVLAQRSDAVTDNKQAPESKLWMRLDDLAGRQVDTPAGSRIGVLGDVLLDDEARIVGFTLSRVQMAGPLAEHPVLPREAVIDTGNEDQVMTIDLALAEKHSLRAAGKSDVAAGAAALEAEAATPLDFEDGGEIAPLQVEMDESVEPDDDAGMAATGEL